MRGKLYIYLQPTVLSMDAKMDLEEVSDEENGYESATVDSYTCFFSPFIINLMQTCFFSHLNMFFRKRVL